MALLTANVLIPYSTSWYLKDLDDIEFDTLLFIAYLQYTFAYFAMEQTTMYFNLYSNIHHLSTLKYRIVIFAKVLARKV